MKWVLLLSVGLLFIGGPSGCGRESHDEVASSGSPAKGAELYAVHCSVCHGEKGEGRWRGNATALNNQDFLATASDEFLQETIMHGRPGTEMLGWGKEAGGLLGKQAIADLVAFLRSWQNEPGRGVATG